MSKPTPVIFHPQLSLVSDELFTIKVATIPEINDPPAKCPNITNKKAAAGNDLEHKL
ncbi:MAG: hypothetical protein R2809_11925 [Flavobacteriales bacterium]